MIYIYLYINLLHNFYTGHGYYIFDIGTKFNCQPLINIYVCVRGTWPEKMPFKHFLRAAIVYCQ